MLVLSSELTEVHSRRSCSVGYCEHSYGPCAPPQLSPFFEAQVLKVPNHEARCPSRDSLPRRNVIKSVAAGTEKGF